MSERSEFQPRNDGSVRVDDWVDGDREGLRAVRGSVQRDWRNVDNETVGVGRGKRHLPFFQVVGGQSVGQTAPYSLHEKVRQIQHQAARLKDRRSVGGAVWYANMGAAEIPRLPNRTEGVLARQNGARAQAGSWSETRTPQKE